MKTQLTILFFFLVLNVNSQELVVYNSIPGRTASDHYVCKVKFESEADDAFRDAFVLQTTCKTDEGYWGNLHGWTASWIAFESDFNGDNVVVEISKKNGTPITKAMVRPVADAEEAVINNGKAYITLSEAANVNVDINGQMEDQYTGHGYTGPAVHTISIFANPVFHVPNASNSNVKVLQPGEDIRALNRADWDTIIFAPGIHDVGLSYKIYDNECLFIPGDAIVKGTIHPLNAWGNDASQFFKIYGSGAISGEDILWRQGERDSKVFTYQAEGAHLEGFVVVDPAFHTFNMYNSGTNINVYKNLKVLGWRVNSDGINAFKNSEISDCFLRVQDDAFYLGNNVKIHDNVVWTDSNGSVLFLQSTGDASQSTFENITVIYHRANWHWWSGGRIISFRTLGDGSKNTNVHIKGVLVEDPYPAFPPFYGTINAGANVTLDNIVIENVHQEHDGVATSTDASRGKPQNTLLGADSNNKFENITFKNSSVR